MIRLRAGGDALNRAPQLHPIPAIPGYQGQPLTIDNLEQAVDRNGLEPRENGVARSIE